ncbi:MAG: thiamine diphosphokinase [SAR324 cluster bacterium]|nr:thiamine diphosphokinase [SAR324 cluster bacterium]
MKKTALIVCNGDPPSLELLHNFWQQADLTVCADGGANFLVSEGFIPDVIVGDMDSLLPEVEQQVEAKRLIKIQEQNTNDADKALRYCLDHHLQIIHMLGIAGGRSDQFLANLELLYKYAPEVKIILWTEQERMEVISKEWEESLMIGTTLSLIPLFGTVNGITTAGLAYPLHNQTLQAGKEPCGVSNKTTLPQVRITIQQGALLLIIQNSSV